MNSIVKGLWELRKDENNGRGSSAQPDTEPETGTSDWDSTISIVMHGMVISVLIAQT